MKSIQVSRRLYRLFTILLVWGILSCDNENRLQEMSAQTIRSATVFVWDSLPNNIKEKIGDYHSYGAGSFQTKDKIRFNREDGYYVLAAINGDYLAELSHSDAFPAIKNRSRYGKYLNNWEFISEDGTDVFPTEKFDGFNTIKVKKNGIIDSVWIGPIPEKPVKMIISLKGDYSSKSKLYPAAILSNYD